MEFAARFLQLHRVMAVGRKVLEWPRMTVEAGTAQQYQEDADDTFHLGRHSTGLCVVCVDGELEKVIYFIYYYANLHEINDSVQAIIAARTFIVSRPQRRYQNNLQLPRNAGHLNSTSDIYLTDYEQQRMLEKRNAANVCSQVRASS